MIDIKDISEGIKLSIEPQGGSIRRFELMKEDYVQPKFSLASPVYFGIGDSVEIEGEPFYITKLMYPSFNTSNAGYDYELRFDSHYFRWRNHTLFYDRQGNKEPSWKLTRSPEAHLGIVVSNIRALGFKYKGLDYQAVVDSSVDTVAKLVEYDNTNIIDALTKIAETWECEWWVDGDKIYLGKCEHGESIDLEIGKEISSMTRSQSKETYANRIYAFGSTRNIPTNYRSNTGDGSVVEGVVTKRLMLPVGIDHIDVIEGLKDSEVVDRVVVFDKVYPRTTCTITSVETKEVTDKPEGGEPETYTVYRFRDSNFHFSSKYILPNEELRIVFQYGPLSGFDFAVTFNPDKASEDTEAGQVFEIVRNQDYGQWLPADPLKPTVGSQFILYGFDTQFISDQLLGNAEQELLEEAQAFVKKLNVDPSTYNCVVNSYLASGYDERNGVLNPDLAINMTAGQKVNLINQAYFKNGRVSRVIGFEKKLDIPYDSPTYIIGESSAYSRIGELEEKIDNIQFKGNTYVNQGGGGSIYVIKKEDPTAASDENVFSSLRTLEEINQIRFSIDEMYLRKDVNDTAHGIISFDQKIGSSIFMDGYDGKGWEIRETGGALFDSAQIRSDVYLGGRIGSPSFASGFTGWGWEIDTPTASGTVDNWTVRKSAKFYEMICSQVYGLNSSFMVSDWNKIESVTPLGSNRYRCRINDMEGEMFVNLRNGDIVRTQKRDGWNIRYFASVVENVSSETFDLKVIEGEDSPQVGDYAQRIGSKTDKNRQGLIYFTSSDDYAPYIDILDGVTSAQFTEDNTKVRIGNLRGIRINGQPLDMHGIYINGGVFQHSTYYMADGNTIEQQFIIMNGKFESTIEGIRNDMSLESGNILRNSSFGNNTNYWSMTNTVHFINVGGDFLWMDGSFYTEKKAVADIYRDGSKNVLRILDTTISQSNTLFNGSKSEGTYSFAFYYKVLRPGTLSAGISGKDLFVSEAMTVCDGYQKLSKVAQWDGTGDFSIGFTGEILIYGVSLFNDALADAQIKLQTQIDQTTEYIKLLATKDYVDSETGQIYVHYDSQLQITAEQMSGISTKVDNINNTINTAGWITRNDSVSLFATKTQVNGLESSVAQLSVQYDQIFSVVGNNTQGITDAKDLANKAYECGVYSQEQYSQTSNPWNSWASRQEFKHVGALWYNPSTKQTKRYIGIDGSNSWETVNDSAVTAASFVLQNKDKWQLVVANFDANGKPTEESGLLTTAYGNTLYAKKDGVISAINQTAEEIKIQASKINLVGATSIGNFTIDGGWFKCNSTTGNDVGYIDMRSPDTRIAFGYDLIPATAGGGITCTAIIANNRAAANGGTAYALSLKASGYATRDSHAVAIDCEGGVRIKGEFSLIEDLFTNINVNISNSSCSSASNLRSRRTFVYSASSYTSIYLPSDNAISSEFGYFTSGNAVVDHSVITIRILVASYSPDNINVQCTIPIIDANGNTMKENNSVNRSNFDLAKGDFAELMYYNRQWYLINLNR